MSWTRASWKFVQGATCQCRHVSQRNMKSTGPVDVDTCSITLCTLFHESYWPHSQFNFVQCRSCQFRQVEHEMLYHLSHDTLWSYAGPLHTTCRYAMKQDVRGPSLNGREKPLECVTAVNCGSLEMRVSNCNQEVPLSAEWLTYSRGREGPSVCVTLIR